MLDFYTPSKHQKTSGGMEVEHWLKMGYPFKRQSHKMVKQTQTIRRQIAGELFECV